MLCSVHTVLVMKNITYSPTFLAWIDYQPIKALASAFVSEVLIRLPFRFWQRCSSMRILLRASSLRRVLTLQYCHHALITDSSVSATKTRKGSLSMRLLTFHKTSRILTRKSDEYPFLTTLRSWIDSRHLNYSARWVNSNDKDRWIWYGMRQ